jgi:hypothetical protein
MNHSLPIYQTNRVLRANVRRLRQLDRLFKAKVNANQRKHLILSVIVWYGIACVPEANALDVDADEYETGGIPADTNLGLLYGQYGNYNSAFSAGHKVSGGDLDTYIGILRYARIVNVGPFVADPQFIIPFGSEHSSGDLNTLGNSSGIGDLFLGSTLWLYRDPNTEHYFGITAGVYAPVGIYNHNRPLNLGSNRWSYVLQQGYVTPLIEKTLVLEVAADATFYGNNNDYGISGQTMSESPLIEIQAWLRYEVTLELDLRIGTAHYSGGEMKIGGVSNHDRESTTTFKAGVGWIFAPSWNVVAYYTTGVQITNGLNEAEGVNFRLAKTF